MFKLIFKQLTNAFHSSLQSFPIPTLIDFPVFNTKIQTVTTQDNPTTQDDIKAQKDIPTEEEMPTLPGNIPPSEITIHDSNKHLDTDQEFLNAPDLAGSTCNNMVDDRIVTILVTRCQDSSPESYSLHFPKSPFR